MALALCTATRHRGGASTRKKVKPYEVVFKAERAVEVGKRCVRASAKQKAKGIFRKLKIFRSFLPAPAHTERGTITTIVGLERTKQACGYTLFTSFGTEIAS